MAINIDWHTIWSGVELIIYAEINEPCAPLSLYNTIHENDSTV